MRSGAWLWSVVAALFWGGCSGGYPLPPTRCDDWCNATKGLQCEYYSPASCVSQCEAMNLDDPSCHDAMDAVIACFEHTPNAASDQCNWRTDLSGMYIPPPCSLENGVLTNCAAMTFQGGYGFPTSEVPPEINR